MCGFGSFSSGPGPRGTLIKSEVDSESSFQLLQATGDRYSKQHHVPYGLSLKFAEIISTVLQLAGNICVFNIVKKERIGERALYIHPQPILSHDQNTCFALPRERQTSSSSRGEVTFKVKDEGGCIKPEREDLQLKHHQTLLSAHNQRVLATGKLQTACVREAAL